MIDAHSPKVSVCIVTFNHERYIERCLQGLLSQETGFDFEVIVGDDCSTDATGRIVDGIAMSDRRVRVLRPISNIGVTQNLLAVHNAATGAYVAHLDGDDMACPGKLAAQAALLDAAPHLVACGHRMTFVDEDGQPNGASYPARLGQSADLRQAIRYGMPFLASSLMYRRAARSLTRSSFEIFDWYFLTDILKHGPAGYIDEALGRYTVNSKSLTASMRRREMRAQMLSLYAMRLAELPQYKSDFFCNAAVAALSCIKRGDPITPEHWRFLSGTFTPRAVLNAVDTLSWHLGNAKALQR